MFKFLIILNLTKSYFRKKIRTREQLFQFQSQKIKTHLKWISSHSDYYKSYKNKELKDWPIMNKMSMMEHFDSLNTQGILKSDAFRIATAAETTRDFRETLKNDITVGLSSGTSGNKGIFLATKKERARWVAEVLLKVLPLQLFKKQRIAFFLRSNSTLYESIRSSVFEFHYFDLKKDLDDLFFDLKLIKPDILIAPPSVLLALSESISREQITWNFKKIISIAEVLESDVKIKLEKIFKQTIHQVYQATEGFLGSTCSEGILHLHEDLVHFEFKFIEGSTSKFHPIISDFCRMSQPIIRYELNDILHLKKEKCKCGSVYTAIDHIEGRSDDILTIGGELIFPDFIRYAVILSSDEIVNFKVVQKSEKLLLVGLQVKHDAKFDEISTLVFENLIALFKQKDHHEIEIDIQPLVNTSFHDKFRRVVNQVKNKPKQD